MAEQSKSDQELREKVDYLLVNLQQEAEMRQGTTNYQPYAEITRKAILSLIKEAGYQKIDKYDIIVRKPGTTKFPMEAKEYVE